MLLTCATSSDVICTCTSSVEPLFTGELLRAGTHLNLIGTFQAHAREVDTVAIQRSRVFGDTYEGAFAEQEISCCHYNRVRSPAKHVRGDLHELVSGEKPGRTGRDDSLCSRASVVRWKILLQRRSSWKLSRPGMRSRDEDKRS